MATINLGAIKFKWQGAYNGATAYSVDDVVSYNGSSYICKLASTGNLPTNATYWEQMSSAGTNGTDGTDLTTTLTTQGDIVYRNASGLARLPAGSANQVLQSGGTGANPSWGTVSSDFVKLAEVTASGGSVSIDGYFSSTYDNYVIIANDVSPSTAADLGLRLIQGGTQNSSNEYVYAGGRSYVDLSPSHLWTTGPSSDWDNPQDAVYLSGDDHSASATHAGHFKMNIFNPLSTSNWKYFDTDWKYNYTDNWNRTFVAGMLKNTAALSGVLLFYNNSANITGNFKLYGIK